MNKILSTAVAATLMAGAGLANAANTTTANLNVSVAVTASCVVSTGTLSIAYTPGLGNPAGGTGNGEGSATMKVQCSPGTNPSTVAFNKGGGTGASIAQRYAMNGTTPLAYNLYTTTAYTTVVGDGTGTSVTLSATGATFAAPVTLTIYGEVPDNAANQALAAGTYTDTVVATLTF